MSSAQLTGGADELVEIRQLARLVCPCAADHAAGVEKERAAPRDVPHPVVLEGDAEAVRRFRIPVGEERKVEVERLHPCDVGVRRVARDRERLHAGALQLRSPVTQELELGRSGGGPVEEIEEQEQRALM